MPRNILIVESGSDLSDVVRTPLENRGFAVQATSDGKGSVELIRRELPELVVMEVELSAGQNGYILCGKLKKDDDLKHTPIVIVGNPDGFAQHRKLKTRADDYLPKPIDADDLVAMVGSLIGFPAAESSELVDDESVSLLMDGEAGDTASFTAEEIEVDADDGQTVGDPDLDLLDGGDVEAEISEVDVDESADEAFSAIDGLGGDEDAPAPPEPSETRIQFPPKREERAAAARPSALGARAVELERARDEAEERARRAEARTAELEAELAARSADLEAARAHRSDKETFALREAGNRKDKEILRLKTEINEKENELVELRDKALQLEQQGSESAGELARRDAQIRALTQKAEQLAQDRRRVEQQLSGARDEARNAAAELDAAQAELESARGDVETLRSEQDGLRAEAKSSAEERDALTRRVSELEETVRRHEDRVARFYSRLKEDEQVREKARKALSIALQLLDQPAPSEPDVDIDLDEPAEA